MIITKSRWIAIASHTLLAIVVMQLCRLLYFFYNQSFFPSVDGWQLLRLMQGGYILDMVAIAYGLLLYYLMMIVGAYLPRRVEMSRWYRWVRHVAYVLPLGVFIFLNVSDTGYYPFVLRRANSDIFREFQGKSMFSFYKDFVVEFWPLTIAFLVLLALTIAGYWLVQYQRKERSSRRSYWVDASCTLGMVIFLFFSMRGSWDLYSKPVSTLHFFSYATDPEQFPLLQNTPVALTKDVATRQLFTFYTDEELPTIFTPYYQAAPLSESDTLFGSMQGRNVVIIILESMAREYTGYLNRYIDGYPSYTPYLDSLMPHTLYAQYGFASGKRSVESFPSIFVSLPSFGGTFDDEAFTMDNYQHFDSYDTGLPLSLGDNGYHLKFYHGDEAGAMGFYSFLNRLGVQDQYTAQDYLAAHPDESSAKVGTWGIHDLPFEQAMAKDMKSLREPFGAFFFSLSNHSPFSMPKGYKGHLKQGTLPIHQTAQYADEALREFFERVKEEPWYRNTLFVITADHTSLSDQPLYANLAGHAAAPILFFDPQGKLQGEVSDYVVQHIDILPTLLYLLGITEPVLSYGSNIFDQQAEHYALNFYHNQYLFFTKALTLTMTADGQVTVKAPAAYLQTEPSRATAPTSSAVKHYTALFKAIVQDYNNRVLKSSFSIRDVTPKSSD